MNKKVLGILVSLIVIAGMLAGCAQPTPTAVPTAAPVATEAPTVEPTAIPTPIVITDALGRTVEFAELPQRVVIAGKAGFMLGVANPTDYKSAPLDSKKYMLAQFSYAFTDNIKAYLNYVGGKRFTDSAKTNQFDVVVTAKVSDKFSLGYNGTVNTTKFQIDDKYDTDAQAWWGSAVYLNLDPTEKFGLTLRSEYFSDKNQLVAMSLAPVGAAVFANTLSANFRIGGLTIIPELRFETSGKDVFYDKEGGPKSGNVSGLLAAVYKF